jgi:hypothetical protein
MSRNLIALSNPQEAPWMHTFLSTSFYEHEVQKYSRSHMLFDSLQLTFSYLLLSPISGMALKVNHERDRYYIAHVYNWNADLTILFTKLPESEQPSGLKGKRMSVESKSGQVSWMYYKLDMNTLYHIRNFWHRHLLDNSHAFLQGASFGENTYAAMARDLAELGHTPNRWTERLQSRSSTMDLLRKGRWYGHYSCLHRPWPKTLKDLDDRQSCAEDWAAIDPLVSRPGPIA